MQLLDVELQKRKGLGTGHWGLGIGHLVELTMPSAKWIMPSAQFLTLAISACGDRRWELAIGVTR
jgi:hypothetical protein